MVVDPKKTIEAGMARLPARMDSVAARVLIHAICRQESRFEVRRQHRNGPAAGFGQFERGGGIKGCMGHRASQDHLRQACAHLGVAFDRTAIWQAIQEPSGDDLAIILCRLLLWTDPRPLPAPVPASEQEAFDTYYRNWRPGAYTNGTSQERAALRAKWGRYWREACAAYQTKQEITHA